ncbi:MAG TPA: DUF996 domain-containing protein [Gammaproteobacteria bacterium]|nr:DUF996 domain-containing protein [Gammaproteobacteria bacterium]
MEKTTKLLGGWGYIALIVGGFLGFMLGPFSGFVTLAGMVCVLIAFFRAGNELNLPSVKRDIVIAIVLNIVAYVLFVFIVGAAVAALVLHMRHTGDMDTGAAAAFGAGTILAGLIGWVLTIIGSWYWYKASQALTDGTGVDTYKTGGLLIFIGSITIIVFGLGALVIWVGEIIQAVAFFSTQEESRDSTEPPAASVG